jgi:hypothetical protein
MEALRATVKDVVPTDKNEKTECEECGALLTLNNVSGVKGLPKTQHLDAMQCGVVKPVCKMCEQAIEEYLKYSVHVYTFEQQVRDQQGDGAPRAGEVLPVRRADGPLGGDVRARARVLGAPGAAVGALVRGSTERAVLGALHSSAEDRRWSGEQEDDGAHDQEARDQEGDAAEA